MWRQVKDSAGCSVPDDHSDASPEILIKSRYPLWTGLGSGIAVVINMNSPICFVLILVCAIHIQSPYHCRLMDRS